MRRLGAVLLGVVLLAACDGSPAPKPSASPEAAAAVSWRELSLPVEGGTAMVRDVVSCPGAWFVVGAVRDGQGGTRPAAWRSADGSSWSSLRFDAFSYYGKQNVLYSAACRDGRLAALGAKSGGAHGYPRTSSWAMSADGVVHEVRAPYTLFGGSTAVNVARMDAGPAGFLIAGNRMSGAAAWVARDASRFEIREGTPGLASDASGVSWAFDGVGLGSGWLLVGGWLAVGRTDRDPAGWSSADGKAWRRLSAEGASEAYEELQRVAVLDGVPVAVGLSGSVFGAWRLSDDRWRASGSFGSVPPGGVSSVRSFAVGGTRLWAATSDGAAFALWSSADAGGRWQPVSLPGALRVGADSAVGLAGGGDRIVLVADDGRAGRIYSAETGS
jgi:hypothetical protein